MLASAGCGSSDSSANAGTSGGAGGATDAGATGSGGPGATGTGGATVPPGKVTCATPPPPGAPEPLPPKAYSGGTCPTLQPGTNTLSSGGAARQFILAVPADHQPGQRLPVAFLWHWLGGKGSDFLSIGSLQAVADKLHFIAVIPEKKGDVAFTWPATVLDSEARFQEELTFFDDMLSCVAAQMDVDLRCVSSVGVSAGALWTDQLAWARSQYLSSVLSLSGGVGNITHAWGDEPHKLPALVVWGGDGDRFSITAAFAADFQVLSRGFEDHLTAGGNFVTECVHNCGHGVPPLAGPPGSNPIEGMVEGLVQFAVDHPYWLGPGESPWKANGLPPGMPDFCAIGVGHAVPRTGDCTGSIGLNNPPPAGGG